MAQNNTTGYVEKYRIDGEMIAADLKEILDGSSDFTRVKNFYGIGGISNYKHKKYGEIGIDIDIRPGATTQVVLSGQNRDELLNVKSTLGTILARKRKGSTLEVTE